MPDTITVFSPIGNVDAMIFFALVWYCSFHIVMHNFLELLVSWLKPYMGIGVAIHAY